MKHDQGQALFTVTLTLLLAMLHGGYFCQILVKAQSDFDIP